jgi:hypothetical protein
MATGLDGAVLTVDQRERRFRASSNATPKMMMMAMMTA